MSALLCLLLLGGCSLSSFTRWAEGKNGPVKPYTILPPHESWCYSSLGAIECYPAPQNLPPESLVSVDPPSRFPMTREEYRKDLNAAQNTPK